MFVDEAVFVYLYLGYERVVVEISWEIGGEISGKLAEDEEETLKNVSKLDDLRCSTVKEKSSMIESYKSTCTHPF